MLKHLVLFLSVKQRRNINRRDITNEARLKEDIETGQLSSKDYGRLYLKYLIKKIVMSAL